MAFDSSRMSSNSGIAADFPGTARCDGVLIGGGRMYGLCVCVCGSQSFANPIRGPPLGKVLVLGHEHMIFRRIMDPSRWVNVHRIVARRRYCKAYGVCWLVRHSRIEPD
jgi:hypothetical protein